jgi:hypothetical protein
MQTNHATIRNGSGVEHAIQYNTIAPIQHQSVSMFKKKITSKKFTSNFKILKIIKKIKKIKKKIKITF